MSSDTEAALANRDVAKSGEGPRSVDRPSTPTPQDVDNIPPSSSQQTLPSTEAPASPVDPTASFKTEANDERIPSSSIIPSSLTPPPSSQVPHNNGPATLGYINARSSILSPPVTGLNSTLRRDAPVSSEYNPPSPGQVVDASPDELRSMLQACIAEHAKLKMETAHHKLQYNLLSLQADEDMKRATVEHEMTRREIEALRMAEHSRQARRELSAATETIHAKYLQLKAMYENLLEDTEGLRNRVKAAKKVIQQKEEDIYNLTEERDILLNRIRENREHFNKLCSPGGIFHEAMTPKTQSISTPVQHRATPRQTPRSLHRYEQRDLAALLHAVNQENNSAPSTPTTSHHPVASRMSSKHIRGAQSLSSLPTTPNTRFRGEHTGLLPSADLIPQTEPARRYGRGLAPETPTRTGDRGRKSRESTISAEDNEELARQALESVAAAHASFTSRASHASRGSRRAHPADENDDEEVFESQASQAASEMLRRDPRESFEVASSIGSRDGTPTPAAAEKSAKLQAKLFAGLNKSGLGNHEKRKLSSGASEPGEDARRDDMSSPTKKLRMAGGLREGSARVGLGIQYGQES
ncbi:FAD-dependent oxidoreductase-like enzyme [Pleurostoma richardsiae]|uniref:FAD-dependent oxidoreductase-like enzyme n=1 Tax=Pleurostoma richardsiae TaxID=41990 RepID=A0AA38VDL0_9PEZI|nr:FAD-dependent oxidoreductase-like enzyme [Pleurostoma richardsiae]